MRPTWISGRTMSDLLLELRDLAGRARTLEDRRRILAHGASFAAMTIRTRTELAEARHDHYRRTGRLPAGVLGGVGNAIHDVITMPAELVNGLWSSALEEEPGTAERILEANTRGLGPPKASFALACAGIGAVGCIDGLLADKHRAILEPIQRPRADDGRPEWVATGPGWARYLTACKTLWGWDSALGQWSEWLEDRAGEGRDIGHSSLLEHHPMRKGRR